MSRAFVLVSVLSFACTLGDADGLHQPTLAEVSPEGDAALDLVDRTSALAAAADNTPGASPELAAAPDAFFFQIDGEAAASELSAATELRSFPTYVNVVTAGVAVVAADVAAAVVVAPPAAAIAFASDGVLVEVTPWLWTATNTAVAPNGASATVVLAVAFVGTGWLAEMRVTSSDGVYTNALWFNGYLAADGSLGWWDLYDGDAVAGVVEWIVLPDGSAEAGIASLSGDNAGDVLAYLAGADGEAAVVYYDASLPFTSYVRVHADQSGEVALAGWNDDLPGCWDPTYADAPCE
jgi:hypothetical protein